MTIKFSDLVKFYRKASFDNETGLASYCIKDTSELSFIKKLTNDINFDSTQMSVESGELGVDNTVLLVVGEPDLQLGWLYQTFYEFIKGDFSRALSTNSIAKNPYYIEELDYFSEDEIVPNRIAKYKTIKGLLLQLASMSVYSDTTNKKLIFYSKHTFELSYDISNRINDIVNLVIDMDHSTAKIIDDFCNWLNDDKTSKHNKEKKSILASVLKSNNSSEESLHLLDVIQDIRSLNKSIYSQYDLYLEDFKYEKFVKKLEENSEKFISRINDSMSKVLSQVLALPIAAAIPAILKSNQIEVDNSSQIIIALALIAYATICYFALTVQDEVLSNIKKQVGQFEEDGKIPSSLKEQWIKDKKQINSLIEKQKHLYYVMIAVVFLVIFYGSTKLISAIFS